MEVCQLECGSSGHISTTGQVAAILKDLRMHELIRVKVRTPPHLSI